MAKKDDSAHPVSAGSGSSRWMRFTALAMVAALGAQAGVRALTRVKIPEHMQNHPAVFVPELFDGDKQQQLLDLLEGKGTIPSNSADTDFYEVLHEHIGEAQPLTAEGKCAHPYLIPNKNRTLCILPGRIDIARMYAMTGGINGLKENLSSLFSRLLSFGIYIFDLDAPDHGVIRSLFDSEEFQGAAAKVCPPHKQHLDPFQFNFIVQVPGQTVATHVDGIYFWGASRFAFPQWLLAVMSFSGLFADRFVDQVQVVGYVSDWERAPVEAAPADFGEFVFWPGPDSDSARRMPPSPRSGNAIDGSKSIHTTTLYRPNQSPPAMDKNQKGRLQRNATTGMWDLVVGNDVMAHYTTQDLRISIVYRARCFESAERAQQFAAEVHDRSHMLDLDTVLTRLRDHGASISRTAPPPLEDRLALALWLLDTYVAYPYPDPAAASVPLNFCALFNSPNLFC